MSACEACLRRQWLLGRLAPNLEPVRRRIDELLLLEDEALVAAVGGRDAPGLLRELTDFGAADVEAILAEAQAAGLQSVCGHRDGYPDRLRELEAPPAVLSINGAEDLAELCERDAVAIVGTRRPSQYGKDAALAMARGLSAAGVTVISGMAFGIDSAAHEGALLGGGRTVAVLAGSAARATPAAKVALFDRLRLSGAVISELGLGADVWRWGLQARNRIIAGLASITVLIEGPERSGALITVRHADQLGRPIGVLPGQAGMPQAAGPNRLLAKARAGRHSVDRLSVNAVRDAQDVLDLIYGEGTLELSAAQMRAPPGEAEAALLAKIQAGCSNVTMIEAGELAALAGLELKGWITRGAGGALTVRAG